MADDPALPSPDTAVTDSEPIVCVRALSKKFKIYPTRWGRLAEWLTLNRSVRHQDFVALQDVSFQVRRGESLGIIGINGSGKSTLLKILSGAMYATSGESNVRGRVLSLLELGTGLNVELTGRQNVINSARLLGFPADYAERRMGQIESFAELGDFFDRAVRLYSSGMLVRLSFSMFACFDPEIFIVDEALSVGDVFFQQKCASRIQQMRANGTTMLFVSHDLAAVEALCDRVLLLHQGRVRHDGDKKAGIGLYYSLGGARLAAQGEIGPGAPRPGMESHGKLEWRQSQSFTTGAPQATSQSPSEFNPESLSWQLPSRQQAFGDGRAEIDGIAFRNEFGSAEPIVTRGQSLEIFARFCAIQDLSACNFGLTIYDRMSRLVFARGWLNADLPPLALRAGDRVVARFVVQLDLEPDEYVLCFTAGEALPDSRSPTGWDQHIGGERFIELPRAAVIAVLPRPDRRRESFGPANLRTRLDRVVIAQASPESVERETAS